MKFLFFDTSALVKRYVLETGSKWVKSIMAPSPTAAIFIARISIVEFTSAIVRRQKANTLSSTAANSILADFRSDIQKQYNLIQNTPALLDDAAALAEKYALRAYDAVQLAAILDLEKRNQKRTTPASITLISADSELNAAASAEKILIDDPNNHP